MDIPFKLPYSIAPDYTKKVAYFCMEYAIHQPLKLYAGGLGFLAGSHLKSAYELKQNLIGIGILWKYGYYDQVRKSDQAMDVLFQEKVYGFLKKTDITFTVKISGHDVHVVVWYLPPTVFKTAPLFLLSTDTEENDYLSKTICYKLYDPNPETRIAAAILLGAGGAQLLDKLGWQPDIYHLNESHALPLAFYLYNKYWNLDDVKKHLVFTSHTPEPAGNQQTNIFLLHKMGFFCGLTLDIVKKICGADGDMLDHTLSAFRLSGIANGVSLKHSLTLQGAWQSYKDICPITHITNAQHFGYWADEKMYKSLWNNNDERLTQRKRECKHQLFEEVADQTGELYDPKVFTLVFAKRFTDYKRAELLLRNTDRFHKLVSSSERPVQIIWAGKPHPMDYNGIAAFDRVVHLSKQYSNCSILVGYELKLSRLLKQGADVWLNVPRLTHEASGTSGMTAAMNGAINVSIPDGWFPEFARDGINSFVIPSSDISLPAYQQDDMDAESLYDLLENTIVPLYYEQPAQWLAIQKNSMSDILCAFDSNRMAKEYYTELYRTAQTEPAEARTAVIALSS